MKSGKLLQWLIVLALVVIALPTAAMSTPPEPHGGMIESIASSLVQHESPPVAGDRCYIRDADQTFCLTAASYTDDWEWIFYLWIRFPDDWTIHDVYVHGTPSCENGGTFDAFSWSTVGLNEVRIEHTRRHADPSDRCEAIYCFDVTSGSETPGRPYALISWYWTGDGSGDPPHYPCSNDGYTPREQPACDEKFWQPALIDPCSCLYLPRVARDD